MSYNDNDGGEVNYDNQADDFTRVSNVDPHRLVQMLLGGALDKIVAVKELMIQRDFSRKGEGINQTLAIVNELRASLDFSAGGKLAENLDDLYEYIERRLVQANFKNNIDMLDEVSSLIREIKTAWDSIPVELRSQKRRGLTVVPTH